jgi:hypothetical protein
MLRRARNCWIRAKTHLAFPFRRLKHCLHQIFGPVTDAHKVYGKLDAVWRVGNQYKLSNRLCNMCCQSCKSNTYSVTFQRVETFSGRLWSAVEAMHMSSIGVASRSAKNERAENFVCVDGHCK